MPARFPVFAPMNNLSKHRWIPAALVLAGALVVAPEAAGVGTRRFQLESLEDLTGGELKGVAVGSDGIVRAGFTLGATPLPGATSVFGALAQSDGSVLVVLTDGEETAVKSFRNLRDVSVMHADAVGVADVIGHARIVVSEAALARLTEKAAAKERAVAK